MWVQRLLVQSFNPPAENHLKKWDLSFNLQGFFRLKLFYPSGKQEYYAFHVSRFKNLEYQGTDSAGNIIFETLQDDIINQTYNDPIGNIDSMSTILRLPVSHLEVKQIDSLRAILQNLSNKK